MRIRIAVFLVLICVNAQAESLPFVYKISEVKRFNESDGLPPKLNVTFELFCNEEFIKVVRHEVIEKAKDEVTIAVGVLVRQNLLSSCAGQSTEKKVSAGKTYSGRKFKIVTIKPSA